MLLRRFRLGLFGRHGGEDLEGEFADVFAWLCTLANINGIDLTKAIEKKYLEGKGPEGHK